MAGLSPVATFITTSREEVVRMGRTMIVLLGLMVGLAIPGLAAAGADGEAVLGREDDGVAVLVASEDDDGDDTHTGNTGAGSGTGDSNDGTNSRHTGVSRDGENSVGDLTRDRTKDGPGGSRIDRSGNGTNDRTRNDTR
jgi:hypothetical protein